MKKVLIIIAVLIAVILLAIYVVFYLTSGMTGASDRFFQAVSEGDLDAAYEQLSEDFKASTTRAELEAFLKNTALMNYRDSSWTSRSMSGRTGRVEGTVETADGGAIPVQIEFVKEQGAWKILNIHKSAAGLVEQPDTAKTIPPEEDLRKMTDACLRDFALAVNQSDFTDFYGTLSELWKSQTSPEELSGIFKDFSDKKVDLTVLSEFEPVYSEPPRFNDDGWLELTGYYPTQPSVTYFTLKYAYEHPDWKLAGIHVTLK